MSELDPVDQPWTLCSRCRHSASRHDDGTECWTRLSDGAEVHDDVPDRCPCGWYTPLSETLQMYAEIHDSNSPDVDRFARGAGYIASLVNAVRLATGTELAEARRKLAAVEALAYQWEQGALRWANPLTVPPEVTALRAALGSAS